MKNYFLRKGSVILEFLFAFLFILLCFIVVITLQFAVLYRTMATYDLMRISRVEGILGNSSFVEGISPDLSDKDFEDKVIEALRRENNIPFGNYVEKVFSTTGMKIKEDKKYSSDTPFKRFSLEYEAPLFKRFSISSKEFYWLEPLKPKEEQE